MYSSNKHWGGIIQLKSHIAETGKDDKLCLKKVIDDIKNCFAKVGKKLTKETNSQLDYDFDVKYRLEKYLLNIDGHN